MLEKPVSYVKKELMKHLLLCIGTKLIDKQKWYFQNIIFISSLKMLKDIQSFLLQGFIENCSKFRCPTIELYYWVKFLAWV